MTKKFKEITNSAACPFTVTIHKHQHKDILYKWLYDVSCDFGYSHVTYLTSLLIVEKYTKKFSFELENYQLIGITALYVAAKIDETMTKPVSMYEYVTDGACDKQQILDTEKYLLEYLDYELVTIMPYECLNLNWIICSLSDDHPAASPGDIISLFCCVLSSLFINQTNADFTVINFKAFKETSTILQSGKVTSALDHFVSKNPSMVKYLTKTDQQS